MNWYEKKNRFGDLIVAELPRTKGLLNQDFTRDRFQAELIRAAYPIVHMATHGQFATEPENSFLVTGDRQRLTLADLDTILRGTPSDIAPQRWRDRPIGYCFSRLARPLRETIAPRWG